MQINSINNVYFGATRLKERLSANPKNKEEADDMLHAVATIGKINRDHRQLMSRMKDEDRSKLADYFKATYLYRKNYSDYEIFQPQELTSKIDRILYEADILSDEEVQKLKTKLQGSFDPEQLIKFYMRKNYQTTQFQHNLTFLKDLMNFNNRETFEIISPITINKILFNDLYSYDDYTHALRTFEADQGYYCSKLENFSPETRIKGIQRAMLHEYLTGEKYCKIREDDIKAARLASSIFDIDSHI